jgi:hypothetical protein
MPPKQKIKSRVIISVTNIKNYLPNKILYVVTVQNITNNNINVDRIYIRYVGNIIPLSRNIWISNNNTYKLKVIINLKPKKNIKFYFVADDKSMSQIVVNNKFSFTYIQ